MTSAQLRQLASKIRTLLDGDSSKKSPPLSTKEDLLALFCLELGFSRAERSFSAADRMLWGDGEAARLAATATWEILAEHGNAGRGGFAVIYGSFPKKHFQTGAQAMLVRQLRQTYPDALFVFARADTLYTGRASTVHIVHARVSGAPERNPDFALSSDAARLVLRRFRLGPGERTRTTAERLARLALGTDTLTAAEVTARCDDAFNKEALTQEFFKKLNQHLGALEKDLLQAAGPAATDADKKEAFTQAQLLLERLIFLYFAQNRGWLEQDTSWFVNRFASHRPRAQATTFYADSLRPLFRSLAKPEFPGRIAGVPFLNGGLFDEDDFEIPSTALPVRNITIGELFDDLLEAYNFTVREDTPLAQEVAVDPEMLGKVFESIVLHAESAGDEYQAPDKRKATGSYYTPRIVVHFICREALRQWFASRDGELADPTRSSDWKARVSAIFCEVEPEDGHLSDRALDALRKLISPGEAARCLARLKKLRTLDPSVGSGAFPVGLLHELIALHQVLEAAANGYKDPATASGRAWRRTTKAHYIEHALFGVDLQQQAVEICRLRLWLSLLVDYELEVDPLEKIDRARFLEAIGHVSQLPNLEMNFKRGDSLLDHLCGRPVTLPSQPSHAFADALQSIEKLGLELHRSTSAQRKRTLRVEILRERYSLSKMVLDEQAQMLSEKLSNFDDFFGGSDRDRKGRDRAESAVNQLKTAQTQLLREQKDFEALLTRSGGKPSPSFYRELRRLEGAEMDGPLNFAWQIDFPHVLSGEKQKFTVAGELSLPGASGQQELHGASPSLTDPGFDLLLGNPPFVTVRNKQKRELYRQRWPIVCFSEFELVSPFFERSFGLLRAGGQLGFIVSNGFAMRDFGKPLVETFFPTVRLQKIVDCSGLMFPGHGTPTWIVFGANETPSESNLVRVASTLPGGGDLRTVPEESPLWSSLSAHHENPNYKDIRIVVGDRTQSAFLKWPIRLDDTGEKTKCAIEQNSSPLSDFIEACGSMFDTHKDDAFVHSPDFVRREQIELKSVVPFVPGDQLRNWFIFEGHYVLKPYDNSWKLLPEDKNSRLFRSLRILKSALNSRATFSGQTYEQAGEPWFRYHQMSVAKITAKLTLAYPEIGTHAHFTPINRGSLLPQTAPVIQFARDDKRNVCLLAGLLNSSSALFWLKQVSFNKGAGKDEHLDRFEYQGKRIKQIPIPICIAEALNGKPNAVATRLTILAEHTWRCGRELSSLALKKLFEKNGEAYCAWNAALPGRVAPHSLLSKPFSTTASLRDVLSQATARRKSLHAEMVAHQEEMDWLCYEAYGLLREGEQAAALVLDGSDLVLEREERPFALSATANGDCEKASALIPRDWSAAKKGLWRARLSCARSNEHINRLEQPVYKRRWDEQWKVGNRWESGPFAYAAEFAEAFAWWLSEAAEAHLERTAKGGPLGLDAWTIALWSDSRVQAAWPVAADAIIQLDHHRAIRKPSAEDDLIQTVKSAKADLVTFSKYFRELIKEQSVAAGLSPGVDWTDLSEKKKFTPAQLSAAKKIRGSLNVPRERFQQRAAGDYLWAARDMGSLVRTGTTHTREATREVARSFALPVATRRVAAADVYLLSLIPELLTQSDGRLSWTEFVQSMSLLGRPHLMEAHALPENAPEVHKWRARGTQLFSMQDVVPALVKLGRHNLGVEGQELVWRGNRLAQHDADFAYDAQLALKVVRDLSVTVSFDAEASTLDDCFGSVEAQLASA